MAQDGFARWAAAAAGGGGAGTGHSPARHAVVQCEGARVSPDSVARKTGAADSLTMSIGIIVGLFFVVLAVIFGVAALGDFPKGQRQVAPGRKARCRIAIIFAIGGLGLVLLNLKGGRYF